MRRNQLIRLEPLHCSALHAAHNDSDSISPLANAADDHSVDLKPQADATIS
jgi:hypothetical protein